MVHRRKFLRSKTAEPAQLFVPFSSGSGSNDKSHFSNHTYDRTNNHHDHQHQVDEISQTSLYTAYFRHVETTTNNNPLCQDECTKPLLEAFLLPTTEQSLRTLKQLQVFVDLLAVRTRFFDDLLYDFVRQGTDNDDKTGVQEGDWNNQKQIVLLGAGMDTRAYRMDFTTTVATTTISRQNVTVYEVDQDEMTQRRKVEVLTKAGYVPTCDKVISIGSDVQDTDVFVSQLEHKGFQSNIPTAWVLEGLLSYIEPENHALLFDAMKSKTCSSQNSIIILSCCSPEWGTWCNSNVDLNLPYARLVEPSEMAKTLHNVGWTNIQIHKTEDLKKVYGRSIHGGITFLTANLGKFQKEY